MDLKLDQLNLLREITLELDSLIEGLQTTRADLHSSLNEIYGFLKEKISLEVFFVETQDENLNMRAFCFGEDANVVKQKVPNLHNLASAQYFETPDACWFAQPLEMAGNNIGSMGLAFSSKAKPEKNFGMELLDGISEELDNFFFSIQQSRLKHSLIMGIQSALKSHSLIDAIDCAVYVLRKEIPFTDLYIFYSDRELTGNEKTNYMIYNQTSKIFDSASNPHPELKKLVDNGENPLSIDPNRLKELISAGEVTVSYLLDGLIQEELIGKAIFVPEQGKTFSIFSRELIQIFTEVLRQRLVDFNRERNNLRKFFSDKIIDKLVSEVGYDSLYLTPRKENIGIIFADISGFTKISEQVLKTPERITQLVDHWSNGILERVFDLDACLDKLVGDCIILLFGPPFYNSQPEKIVANLLEASKRIIDFTREFLNSEENSEIKQHPDFEKFGVAIGVNYCPTVVGLIGPNQDLTAFSSGMNITARLQGLASADQILVTEEVARICNQTPDNKWEFGPEGSAPVKNVAKPLKFFPLKLD